MTGGRTDRVARRDRLRRIGIWLAILVAVWTVATQVPLIRYQPFCLPQRVAERFGPPDFEKAGFYTYINGPISQPFAEEVTGLLRDFRVRYFQSGTLILLPYWAWYADPDDLVLNANSKSLWALADPERRPEFQQTMPSDVRRLIDSRLKLSYSDASSRCDVARALAIENWGR